MNCEIQPLKDRRRPVDTLPPRGKVSEVRKEWLVHEDGALAYRLQDEEFKQHLTGNKSRNIQIREDFPCAREEQSKECQEAAREHQRWLQQMEEEGARVASQVAAQIEQEEAERRVKDEERDKALARRLQEKEARKKQEWRDLEAHTPRKEKLRHSHQNSLAASRTLYGDDDVAGCVVDTTPGSRSPVYDDSPPNLRNSNFPVEEELAHSLRSCRMPSRYSPSPPLMSEDDARRLQEERDAEFARTLQEQEEEAVDPVTRDRLLAIETQDKELARLLQEKEKARLRRARERAKARAAAKRAEQEAAAAAETPLPPKPKPRYPDPEEIVALNENSVGNIAMVIDPTYPGGRQGPPELDQEPVDNIAPPYMPIQGQRRFPEKKQKSKDGCKPQ